MTIAYPVTIYARAWMDGSVGDSSYATTNKSIQYTGTITVNYHTNYASGTYKSNPISGASDSTDVVIYNGTYSPFTTYDDGLPDIQNPEWINLSKTGFENSGYWGTSSNGGTLLNDQKGWTGKELAQTLGVDINGKNNTVNLYPQWLGEPILTEVRQIDKSNTVYVMGRLPDYGQCMPPSSSELICYAFNGNTESYEELYHEWNPSGNNISSGLQWNYPKRLTVNETHTKVKVEYKCSYQLGDTTGYTYITRVIPVVYVPPYVKIYAKYNGVYTEGTLYARKTINDEFKPVVSLHQKQSTGSYKQIK